MKLTVVTIKGAKPKDKPYKLIDGGGLHLLINKKGAKYWRYNYRYNAKHKTLSLGVYPDVSLKEARDLHYQAKKQLGEGIDPSLQRKIEKVTKQDQEKNSFKAIALEWIEKQRPTLAKSTIKNIEGRLKNHIFDHIGNRVISDITAPELLALLRRIESTGHHETAHRVRNLCGKVFRYAIVTGRAERDPSADLQGALIAVTTTNYPALTGPKEIGGLLRAIDDYSGDYVTKCALRLAPLVFVRPSNLRRAEWKEIDFENKQWLIPAEKMKKKEDHIVPLCNQAIEILIAIKAVTDGERYIFPSVRTKTRPMSENTINASLRRMGYTKEEMTGHGFRAMASTLLNEQGFNVDWIEVQLAHKEQNKIRGAYNRAKYLPQRKTMMQQWANYLDTLRNGADVIPIGHKA